VPEPPSDAQQKELLSLGIAARRPFFVVIAGGGGDYAWLNNVGQGIAFKTTWHFVDAARFGGLVKPESMGAMPVGNARPLAIDDHVFYRTHQNHNRSRLVLDHAPCEGRHTSPPMFLPLLLLHLVHRVNAEKPTFSLPRLMPCQESTILLYGCEGNLSKQNILFLAANPLDTGRLRLEAEMRDVQEGLQRATQRDDFQFACEFAVRVRDLRRSLLDVQPQIVHFSGHGSGTDGIILENDEGESVLVGTDALANLFALHKATVRCVLLNACYSKEQAEAICQHIPFVIGMSNSIADDSAAAFAVGFYDAIGAGRTFEEAFSHGTNAIELLGLPNHEIPVMLKGTAIESNAPDHTMSSGQPPVGNEVQGTNLAESRYRSLIEELTALGNELTRFVHCIGMHSAVPFDQIYQPTKLLFRSGFDISASAAFGEQNKIAQSIAISRGEEFNSLTIESLLESPEDTIIFAGPGWGKTTFLHHIFRRKVEDRNTRTVLITLRRDGAINELEELSRFWLTHQSQPAQKVILLVDGYDEVSLADRKRVSESLQRFSASKRGRFILTCRDYYHVIGLTASHVRIDGFDRNDQYRFVTAFLVAQGSSVDPIKLVNELEERQFS
jgi:hypothetical protein